jgi:hypothetical protein
MQPLGFDVADEMGSKLVAGIYQDLVHFFY